MLKNKWVRSLLESVIALAGFSVAFLVIDYYGREMLTFEYLYAYIRYFAWIGFLAIVFRRRILGYSCLTGVLTGHLIEAILIKPYGNAYPGAGVAVICFAIMAAFFVLGLVAEIVYFLALIKRTQYKG